ncbi:hypothetical protein FRC10_006117 [Ceratobasidium sp. 414]|nr:hypothetical protein FRC10_006117 [Ceratobasidium sp. 414]
MPIKVPDEIAKIYDYLPFKPEHYRLDTEPRYATPGKRSVLVRALDDFVFIKDGKFAYPIYGLSTDWWNGVTAYGWMMSPVGEFKYMAWAGDWGSSFPGKHMELVELKNLRGLSKEANKHWRKGQEEALWLETRECMTYVLLEPAKPYDAAAGWGCVIASWTKLPGAQSQRDPTFTPIDPEDDRPAWWFGSDSNKSWNHFQRPIKEAERREAAARKRKVEKGKGKKPLRKSGHAVDGKGGLVDPGKRGTEVKVRVASSNSEPGPSTVGKRKRESDATASKAEQLPKKRVRLEHVDIDDGSPTSDANVSDLEVPQPLEKAKPRYTDVGRDSSAQPATPRSATPSAPPPPTSQSGGGSQPPLLPDSEPARDDERNGSGASAGETTSDWSTTGGGKSHTQMEADGKEPGPATLENALLSHRKNSSPQSNGETEGCVSQILSRLFGTAHRIQGFEQPVPAWRQRRSYVDRAEHADGAEPGL